jgi:hypothetical protein
VIYDLLNDPDAILDGFVTWLMAHAWLVLFSAHRGDWDFSGAVP